MYVPGPGAVYIYGIITSDTDIHELGKYVEPPTLIQYDHFGQRIDQLKTSEGWRQLKQVATKEGMVSIAYDRANHGSLARILMFIKTCLWVTCPLAMTDGAARVLELIGTCHMKEWLLPRLLSRDPQLAYTAGQWMTERPGGSDVSHTETIAHPVYPNDTMQNGAPYRLSGVKWFSSATDGQLALALAQVPNQGLALFVVPMPSADVELFSPNTHLLSFQLRNGINIHRLKNKVGTHALPTAELELEDTIGFLLIAPSQTQGTIKPNGVRTISPVLNITRLHSAATSIGNLAKCLAIARSYAQVRQVADPTPGRVGGQALLVDVPLHTATLARVEVLRHALTHFLFGVVQLLGASEAGTATNSERVRLRLLTPVLKAFAADRAVGGMEECMAALGGLGYMEETGIGRLIRDSLVEKIWEGTVNVLALDMLRAMRGGDAIKAFCEVCLSPCVFVAMVASYYRPVPRTLYQPHQTTTDTARKSKPQQLQFTRAPGPSARGTSRFRVISITARTVVSTRARRCDRPTLDRGGARGEACLGRRPRLEQDDSVPVYCQAMIKPDQGVGDSLPGSRPKSPPPLLKSDVAVVLFCGMRNHGVWGYHIPSLVQREFPPSAWVILMTTSDRSPSQITGGRGERLGVFAKYGVARPFGLVLERGLRLRDTHVVVCGMHMGDVQSGKDRRAKNRVLGEPANQQVQIRQPITVDQYIHPVGTGCVDAGGMITGFDAVLAPGCVHVRGTDGMCVPNYVYDVEG
ncbi:acyl-CoA dehydrogenase domain-containing protein [Rhizoctonia solani AG-1 IA]|uniref:Acyl-CoA dehydrogenase domain-containing protein n=1 Tax=Thanatephorus cucumeris (strain AG1-IA) TaxID=983506 RepID=L8WKK9_THACA|nr:acyl-CoA dehydrogenase domain-containing protein [Rhizoctonia solani AG-1 IA]